MNEVNKKINTRQKYPTYLVFLFVLITLYVNPGMADPINSAKFLLLVVTGLISFVICICFFRKIIKLPKKIILIFIYFITALFFSLVFSNNFKIAFFGETQRKLGFITYFSFILIAFAWVLIFETNSLNLLNRAFIFMAILHAIYGYLQSTGWDFISWSNPYNSIILTLGNPNFASAMMAIEFCWIGGYLLRKNIHLLLRFILILTLLVLLYNILQSQSRQGIYAIVAGLVVSAFFLIPNHSKFLRFTYGLMGSIFIIVATMGMLQIGFLSKYLYKPSVSIRGFYWRAAFEMFKENPLFGVGLDRYGYFFKQYREVGYPLNYGFDITSTNAHNVYLQLLATGGIFLFTSYLALVLLTFYCGCKVLVKVKGNDKYILISVFSSWIAFQAQSLISIDNLGVTIWGWILSATLIAAYISSNLEIDVKNRLSIPIVNLSILLILVLALFPLSLVFKSEQITFKIRTIMNSKLPDNSFLIKTGTDLLKNPVSDDSYRIQLGSYYFESGLREEGIKILENVSVSDPDNLDALNSLAVCYSNIGDNNKVIEIREKIRTKDPWGAVNLYNLALAYKQAGKIELESNLKNQILSFAANTDIGKLATSNLS